jgi:hypothetical protein
MPPGPGVRRHRRCRPLHKKLNNSITMRCADKPPGCAESSGQALSAHPLGLSAHLVVMELLSFCVAVDVCYHHTVILQ